MCEVGGNLEDVVAWKRWEKTAANSKDFVLKKDRVSSLLNVLEREILLVWGNIYTQLTGSGNSISL